MMRQVRTKSAGAARGRSAALRARRTFDGGHAAAATGHAEAAMLAYVNAAIHAADALCIFARHEFAQGEAHEMALHLIQQVPDGQQFAKHLKVALEAKRRYTYDVSAIPASELTKIARAAKALVSAAEAMS